MEMKLIAYKQDVLSLFFHSQPAKLYYKHTALCYYPTLTIFIIYIFLSRQQQSSPLSFFLLLLPLTNYRFFTCLYLSFFVPYYPCLLSLFLIGFTVLSVSISFKFQTDNLINSKGMTCLQLSITFREKFRMEIYFSSQL